MQDRNKSVLDFWGRDKFLSIKNPDYRRFVFDFFMFYSKLDKSGNDITSNSVIEKDKGISAVFIAKENGIAAGLEEIESLSGNFQFKSLKKDGDKIKKGEKLLELKGNARTILGFERLFLNILQRMSGIATTSYELNQKIGNKVKIAATRKTLWSYLDKKAVTVGGGLSHRLNLEDGILIKDNHLAISKSISSSLNSANNKSRFVEIEVETKEQALIAAKTIASIQKTNSKSQFAIMFDKINPKEIKKIILEIRKLDNTEEILFEASGNITSKNIMEYKNCGVDIISMGSPTHSVKSLDISLEIK